jgi:sRNA-binding carbon storage regulator CsrA
MLDEKELEKEFQDKGLTAPRITPGAIDAQIVGEAYHIFSGTTVTVCCLKLKNGFTTVGESACASVENFNEEIGRKLAKENARNKIWQLEGYLLRERIYQGQLTNM